MELFITNTLTKKLEKFEPLDRSNIKIYACGPTVYSRPHIGNMRSAVTFDILFRTLRYLYKNVTYVRNITDIDDKIIIAAKERGIPIKSLTEEATRYYHSDLTKLNCLKPTYEPQATAYIDKMINMIHTMISKDYAYIAKNNVLFSTRKISDYGILSNRNLDDMMAGARIETEEYKSDPMDFILWKPAKLGELEYAFHSPWGFGRPGWHIECSAISTSLLGRRFDIHCGGEDLIFPHHENEIAQNCATYHTPCAKYWIHNGLLTVNNEKMSKSLNNFKAIDEILGDVFASNALRYFYLTKHYRKPIDLNNKSLYDAKLALQKFSHNIHKFELQNQHATIMEENKEYMDEIMQIICDDLNTPEALGYLHKLSNDVSQKNSRNSAIKLMLGMKFLGLSINERNNDNLQYDIKQIPANITLLGQQRAIAKDKKDWLLADSIRNEIIALGYQIIDTKEGFIIKKQ